MSSNKFVVKAKTPSNKETKSENRAPKSDEQSTKKRNEVSNNKKKSSEKKPNTPKEKKHTPSEVKKPNLLFPKQEVPEVESLGNLKLSERIKKLNGEKPLEKEKKVEKKESKGERDNIKYIKKVIEEKKSVEIPEVGHRNEEYQKQKSNTLLKLIFSLLFLVLILTIAILSINRSRVSYSISNESLVSQNDFILEIKSGASAISVSKALPSFYDSNKFLEVLESLNLTSKIQVGTFLIPSYSSYEEVARIITTKVSSSVLNLYAGFTLKDITSALVNRGLSYDDLTLKAESFKKVNNLSFTEGYFLAGSYEFTSSTKLLSDMHNALLDLLREHAAAVSSSGLSVDEIVKIASIINREDQSYDNLRVISKIVLNRYFLNMPLGIDATTRYELDNWTDPINQKSFEKNTPYNTRRKPGLPPSGIGCPGKEAILAVLYPAETEALYYLHDSEKNLYTSNTYDEHLAIYKSIQNR